MASRRTGVATVPSMTPSIILTPKLQLEPGRCKSGCSLEEEGRRLTNEPRSQPGPRPFAFLGTCGSVALDQPALHYWTVTCKVRFASPGDRCEFGLASLQTLDTCGEGQRISDHDVNSATLVAVRDENRQRLEGRNWTKDVRTPPPPQTCDVTYTCLWESESWCGFLRTLGFVYDNRQPQSPRVLVVAVDAKTCPLVGVRRLSPSAPLRPVLRLWPTHDLLEDADAELEVRSGPGILSDFAARKLRTMANEVMNS